MKCPVDGATLVMSERQNIEIDYCPECRGVWLDRGELDKILDRAAADTPAAAAPPDYRQQHPNEVYQGDAQRGYQQGARRPKKKEHWLSELFD